MAFDPTDFSIEAWLRLEVENVLQKVCSLYDTDGRLVEEWKTRVSVVPVGKYPAVSTVKSISAPALYRAFWYNESGAMIARIPYMAEWTQACEDAANGGVLNPSDPNIVPHGAVIVPVLAEFGEVNAVPSNATQSVLSYTVPLGEKSYIRNIRASGDNRAVYFIRKNLSVIREMRAWWTSFDAETSFASADGGLLLEETDTIEILVWNKGVEPARFTVSIAFVNAQ